MDEAEWLASEDGESMLEFIANSRGGGRKFRLFAVASVRPFWHVLIDERSRNALAVAEQYAEGMICEDALLEAEEAAHWDVVYESSQLSGETDQIAGDNTPTLAFTYYILSA